ncbi:MAG: hypothetical protein KGK08_01705 [Acidobacteriota bacterium]|nr:hypothetical protein [Acidobacteriota bacterium]
MADPFCFRHNAVWFNSAGLKYGNRLRLCWAYPGQVRFNQSSGFNPEFPNRILGRTFECNKPSLMHGRMHLLVTRSLDRDDTPDWYLVTFTEQHCGTIQFSRPGWMSDGVQLISVSLRRDRYEVIALFGTADWIESDVGPWMLSQDRKRLVLTDSTSGGQR